MHRSQSSKWPMPRVLTIEDDLVTAEEIATELRSHGFEVDRVGNGEDGLAMACRGDYAVITLDRMLPGMDGLALVTALRRQGITTPVLMISALSDVDERVRGLRAGGDDYLTKPFASDEMAARVEVLIRRHGQPAVAENQLRAGDLELDLMTRTARRAAPAKRSPCCRPNSNCWNSSCATPARWSPAPCCSRRYGATTSILAPT